MTTTCRIDIEEVQHDIGENPHSPPPRHRGRSWFSSHDGYPLHNHQAGWPYTAVAAETEGVST